MLLTTDDAELGLQSTIIDRRKLPFPVERYSTTEEALGGHMRWHKLLLDGLMTIKCLGCEPFVQPGLYVLHPRNKQHPLHKL
jgi:hypothetical protein